MNSKWFQSKLNFRDVAHHYNFQCPCCPEKHSLETWCNRSGNILYLDRNYEKSNCQFLNKYNEGIIYDYRQKEIEKVIKDNLDREIATKIRKEQQVNIKREKRRKIIQGKMEEKGLKIIGVGEDLEAVGIELLKQFTCDNCEQLFTEKDIQGKNYQISYSRAYVLYSPELGGCQVENHLREAKHQKCEN